MADLSEDVEAEIEKLKACVTKRDAWRAARHLLRIGGEVGGFIGVIIAGFWGMGVAAAFLGPLGIALPTPVIYKAIEGLANAYHDLGTDDRLQVRIVLAYSRRLFTGL